MREEVEKGGKREGEEKGRVEGRRKRRGRIRKGGKIGSGEERKG